MNVDIHVDSSKRHKDGLAVISVRVPDLELDYDLDLRFKELYERCSIPDLTTLDFLIVASLCYVIDKIVSRKNSPDNWTREFEVEFPVSDPDLWKTVTPHFEAALSFLTGDIWQVSFRKTETGFFRPPRKRRHYRLRIIPRNIPVTAACLFSGGIDSLTGAIDFLAENNDQRVLLVGHYDASGPRKQQQDLFAQIREYYPGRVGLVQTRVSHKPEAAEESSLRSRSLVFMALGIYAARASGSEVPLYAPENGLIAINVPLTPSRSGSCSTRTMHPFFLDKLESVLLGLGFNNRVVNPFSLKTKGECIVECRNQQLLRSVVDISVSCSHGTRRQNWIRKKANNCGYCVPCIIRRASLHKTGLDDGQKYGIDVCRGEMPIDDEGDSADDLRAILDFLHSRKTADEILQEIIAVAPVKYLQDYTTLVERGIDEIRTLFHDKANAQSPGSWLTYE